MAVLATPDLVEQPAAELRQASLHLQDLQDTLTSRARALHWEGGGVEQFHTQLGRADRVSTHCIDVLDQVVRLLGQAVTDLNHARAALVRAENFVMKAVVEHGSSDPGAYLHSLGWTQYPVLPARYSTEWEDLAIRAGYRP